MKKGPGSRKERKSMEAPDSMMSSAQVSGLPLQSEQSTAKARGKEPPAREGEFEV